MDAVASSVRALPGTPAARQIVWVATFLPRAGRDGRSVYLRSLMRFFQRRGWRNVLYLPEAPLGVWSPFVGVPEDVTTLADVQLGDRRLWRGRHIEPRLWRWPVMMLLWALRYAAHRLLPVFRGVRLPMARRRTRPGVGRTQNIVVPSTRCYDALVRAPATGAVIANYVWTAPLLDRVPGGGAIVRVIVTHDLFHRRRVAYAEHGLDAHGYDDCTEASLVRRADVIAAIQPDECAEFRRMAPDRRVVLCPVAIDIVEHRQPPDPRRLLFVASAARKNLPGLSWFLESVWPRIRGHLPDAECELAGGVCRWLGRDVPEGVKRLGRVDDLGPVYGRTGVVVLPVSLGSGLNIKLVEALAHGRACVATTTAVGGVRRWVDEAVLLADEPAAFADACVRLMRDDCERRTRGIAAHRIARDHFSESAAYQALADAIDDAGQSTVPAAADSRNVA